MSLATPSTKYRSEKSPIGLTGVEAVVNPQSGEWNHTCPPGAETAWVLALGGCRLKFGEVTSSVIALGRQGRGNVTLKNGTRINRAKARRRSRLEAGGKRARGTF